MKVLLTADVHCGYRKWEPIWALKVMREYAKVEGIEHVVVMGDLFDDRQKLSIDILNDVIEFFEELENNYDQEWIAFIGNHDMFMKNSWDINSLKILNKYINVISDISKFDIDGRLFWCIPFMHYESAYMNVVSDVDKQASENDILLTHIGVKNASLNNCFLLKNWSIVDFENTKFEKVFAGHFHCHQSIGKLTYPGSPIPFRFDEGLVPHGFLVYDTESGQHEFIEIFEIAKDLGFDENRPPDYITIDDVDIDSVEADRECVRVNLTKHYSSLELDNLRDKLINKGAIRVSWHKFKEDKIDIDNETFLSPEFNKSILLSYFDEVTPDGLDRELISKLDDNICKLADEAMAEDDNIDVD